MSGDAQVKEIFLPFRQLPGGRWHDDGHLTLDDLKRIHESVKEEIMHESESVLQWVRSSQGVLRCRMCPYKTKDEDKFEKHQGSVHRLRGKPESPLQGQAKYSCDHCDFTTSIGQNLRRHEHSCSGFPRNKLFRCPQCPFQTPRMHEISRHMNAHLFGAVAEARLQLHPSVAVSHRESPLSEDDAEIIVGDEE
ncbi:RE1-silencing transcription factor-like [Galendromus occidentalis]|uniref:RE1-silencing transcription factor-like n=1 Tax=Galendromus occidentalis TaxID=34638 RepID=A0AAJ7WHT0_9ACAR|nr:RE1-silencing transcription factor-like [Galendromus occidentalis]